MKIIVADDHPVIREGFKTLLELERGIDSVFLAPNGKHVLELVANHSIDVVLLDLRMPILGGRETLEILSHQYPSVKVIIFTMENSPTLESELRSMGACDFVNKSVAIPDLIKKIRYVYHQPKASITIPPKTSKELSIREQEVVRLLADGLTTQKISDRLCISPKTIENHKTNIFKKLSVTNTALLIKKASELLIIN